MEYKTDINDLIIDWWTEEKSAINSLKEKQKMTKK